MTATVTRCGAETPNGPCGRKVAPGNVCAFHPANGTNGPPDADALVAEICACDDPLPVDDTDEPSCLKCGRPPRSKLRGGAREGLRNTHRGSQPPPRPPATAPLEGQAPARLGVSVVGAELSDQQTRGAQMPTATASASEQLAEIQKARDKAHAKVRAAKAKRTAWADELPVLKARLDAHCEAHPEEVEGNQKKPRPDTEAARLRDEIRSRMAQENPHQAEYDQAFGPYEAVDVELQAFQRSSARDRIAEHDPDFEAAAEAIRDGFELLLKGCGQYAAAVEVVREIVLTCPGLTGQHIGYDDRPGVWARVAEQALDGELIPASLTAEGYWKLDQ